MSFLSFSRASANVAIAILCGAAALAAVRLFGSGIVSISADREPAARLIIALFAPLSLVLLALGVEKIGGVAERVTSMQPE